jgi:hypothetical protein
MANSSTVAELEEALKPQTHENLAPRALDEFAEPKLQPSTFNQPHSKVGMRHPAYENNTRGQVMRQGRNMDKQIMQPMKNRGSIQHNLAKQAQ